ncbi:FecR family protein [Chondrinema litorale]|uniref:FecR family protein n=1 Tax=Chondrinema litorale TaxID=2994555 RepID=UPI0025432CFF|nr:FecR family protein [Chondrinema litorale]UZR97697.1 DUF4974 domain-containing protein [Chondrinema litorale]
MNFREYTVEDFIKDEYFVEWVKHDNEEAGEFWMEWTRNNPDKQNDVLQAKYIIQHMRVENYPKISEEDASELHDRIFNPTLKKHQYIPPKKSFSFHYKKIAAVLIPLAIGLVAWLFYAQKQHFDNAQSIAETELINKEVTYGHKLTLALSDGTKIKLNSGSTLKFPKQFTGDTRKVYLTGEGFFEVAENPKKPFIVVTNNIEAKVLGTSFNIRAYEQLEVALVTGKLQVNDHIGNSIVIKPDERVIYQKEGNFVKDKFNKDEVLAWKNGTLSFKQAQLKDILKELERWYDVSFIKDELWEPKYLFTGEFDNESLDNVLIGLNISYNFDFKIEGKKVTLIKK